MDTSNHTEEPCKQKLPPESPEEIIRGNQTIDGQAEESQTSDADCSRDAVPDPSMQAPYVSIFTSTGKPLSKGILLDAENNIVKYGGGILVEGEYRRETVANLAELDTLLSGLTTQQAVSYGVADVEKAPIRAKEKASHIEGAISRSKGVFHWEGAGIFMIDYDPEENKPALSPNQLYKAICKAMPELAGVSMLWRPSASSCIYNSDSGKNITRITGQRLYFIVDDAAAIPSIGDILFKRLWLKGNGYIFISAPGGMLTRTIVDAMVWQPERLDFAAGAQCRPPLERRPEDGVIGPGSRLLNASAVQPLTPEEDATYSDLVTKAKDVVQEKARTVKNNYEMKMVDKAVGPNATPREKVMARRTIRRALEGQVLNTDFPLQLADGCIVIVADILADKAKYHKATLCDPLEPEYRGGNNAKFFLDGKSEIYSWAHGGRTFKLAEKTAAVDGAIEDDESIITRMAGLTLPDYERARKDQAKEMGIRTNALDKLVEAERKNQAQNNAAVDVVETLEPWDKSVDATTLLDETVKILTDHVVLPPGSADALALWLLASYSMDVWLLFPKLLVHSPDMRCGKTTLLEVLECFAYRSLMASNISASAIFRCIQLYGPTLFLDEADTFMKGNDEMNGIINAGHKKRSASIIRTEKIDGNFLPVKFSVWSPQIIAGIGEQRGTLHDRSICIELRRKLASEKINKLPFNGYEQGVDFRRKCMRWADDNATGLRATKIVAPALGNDRAQDNWKPLFAVAEVAGSKWLKKAETAYTALNTAASNASFSMNVTLLSDIKDIFDTLATDKIFSSDLVKKLVALEERPWSDLGKGRSLTQNKMASMLRQYNCKSGSIRIGKESRKGYQKDSFEDAFKRYL